MKLPSIAERLAGNRFHLDEECSHITIDQDLARSTGTAERIIAACPAGVYSLSEDDSVLIEYAGCLECGTCLAIASPGVLTWRYPRGGFGVQFRDG
ncbi:MAG: 4Fe-4S dicluster domain-containing protein [Propionibacteriaceae bacterium]|jgi:ferredoxin like protein|nr:4Fe-4S dicluster domain-containing protein [Propionibacteriaceae bacterium]